MSHNLVKMVRWMTLNRTVWCQASNSVPVSSRLISSRLTPSSSRLFFSSPSSSLLVHSIKNHRLKHGLQNLSRNSFDKAAGNLLFRIDQVSVQRFARVYFHTTRPNQALPAIVWVILRPIGKIMAALMGRSLRKWYQSLPPNKRQLFKQWLIDNYVKIVMVLSGIAGLAFAFYQTHLQETPVTKRKRFIVFTEKQYAGLADFEFQAALSAYQDKLIPAIHPICRRIERVAMKLLNANQDIQQIFNKKWTVTVVDAPEVKNAFVTPNGQIFVFTGILTLCQNDDQLGVILAHEMAHSILGHAAELLSYTSLVDFFVIMVIALIWAVLPSDSLAALAHFLIGKILSLALQLPFNRKLETEADEVGLQMAAKACFDVREFVAFWKRMHFYETLELGLPPELDVIKEAEFLSTHPAHSSRAEYLEGLLNEALRLRESCNCPRLSRIDPVAVLEREKELYAKRMQQEKLKNIIVLNVGPPPVKL